VPDFGSIKPLEVHEDDPVANAEERQSNQDDLDRKQDREHREKFAHRGWVTIIIWLGFVALLIILQGFKAWGFNLDDSIVLTIIGATTASIIGMHVVVLNYLFPKR